MPAQGSSLVNTDEWQNISKEHPENYQGSLVNYIWQIYEKTLNAFFMCILPIYMSGCENFPFQRATELELGFIVKLGWLVANGYNWTELGMERYSANKVK